MTNTKNTVPEIQKLKLSELIADISLSGRSEKEIAANAKALAPAIESAEGWDVTQPGAFFTRDGKKHLARGFTRHAAALIAGFKDGYFVEIADDPAKLRTEAIRSNMGKPIALFEQGRIYCQMRDGTNVEESSAGDVILAPMKVAAIAKDVGYTLQHVSNCMAIFEETPEIGELLEQELISPTIVIRAKQLVKDDAKRLKFLKAAIKAAGGEKATMKHLDAVRAEHAPIKAAAVKSTSASPAPSDSPEAGAKESNDSKHSDHDAAPSDPPADAADQPSLSDLGAPSKGPAKSISDTAKKRLVALISKWGDENGVAMSDDDINALVDALEEAAIPF